MALPFASFLHWLFPEPSVSPSAGGATSSRIQEEINPMAIASLPVQEDWYWGKLATGGEEDWYWRRLSDNWLQKDVIPTQYPTSHLKLCRYNARKELFMPLDSRKEQHMQQVITPEQLAQSA